MALFYEGRYCPINAFLDRGDDLERIVFMPAKKPVSKLSLSARDVMETYPG
jgi:hypothetical protein